jgi:inner membrane protein
MSRAAFTRKTALATVTMVLAAEAPDIDMLAYFDGSDVGFVHHRGFTHTVFGIPVVSALVLALVYGGYWMYRKRWPVEQNRPASDRAPLLPRWGLLYGLACLAGYSHLLLDFTNNYGIRPLWPFWNHWVAWDTVFILEPLILLFLIGGLLLPSLFGLVNQEIGAKSRGPKGRGGAITALVLVALLWGVRDYEHRRAISAMDAVTYHDHDPLRVGAFPYYTNPFKWHGVAETEKTYESVRVDSLTPEVDPQGRERTYYKAQDSDVIRAAKASYLGRAYVDWARFLQIEVERRELPTQYVVRFRDLRFAYPERRSTPLSAFVVLDENLKVIREGFMSRNPVKDRLESPSPPEEENRP